MKYQLLPLDPELDPVDFDTESILDLALLGPYDKDAGVVYFDGVACLEPRPDKTTMGHVRKLEAEMLAIKAERDRLLAVAESTLEFISRICELRRRGWMVEVATQLGDVEQLMSDTIAAIAAAKGDK